MKNHAYYPRPTIIQNMTVLRPEIRKNPGSNLEGYLQHLLNNKEYTPNGNASNSNQR